MSDTVLKYQCPACGGALQFSPEKQMLVCESCDSEFASDIIKDDEQSGETPTITGNTERIDWNIEGYVKEQSEITEVSGFSCTSCGAEIASGGDTVATECMYCGNPVVMTENTNGLVKPDMVIPFKIDKKQAEQMLKEFYEGKKLLPDAFTRDNRVSKISGLYVPFWLFSCSGSGSVCFDATKVHRWSDNNYNYTKTEYYEIIRSGEIGFDKIPVDASAKMEDHYMDGIEPFDYSDLVDFDTLYLAGYFADKFDVNVSDSSERASKRVINSTENAFRETIKGYTTVSKKTSFLQMSDKDIRYALLPVWMLNTKYEGKMYQFAINGQTGKVSGELPVDKAKLWKWRIGLALGSMIPFSAIAYFMFS